MATVIWVVGAIASVAALGLLSMYTRSWLDRRRERLWDEAREKAAWEVTTVSQNGKSLVVVRKVARMGRRLTEVIDQHFVGSVAWDRDDYATELSRLELEATTRAFQLNAGAVT